MSRVVTIVVKDWRAEVRGAGRFVAIALFAGTVLLSLGFALPSDSPSRPLAAAGVIWVSILLSIVLDLRATWDAEVRDATLDALRTSPTTPSELFTAKVIATWIWVAILAAFVCVAAAYGFATDKTSLTSAWLVVVVAAISPIAWGTLFSVMCIRLKGGEVLLPVLLFPLSIPATIAGVSLLSKFLASGDVGSGAWVILISVNLVALGSSLLLFEYALDE